MSDTECDFFFLAKINELVALYRSWGGELL